MPRSQRGADGSISLANPKKHGCKKKVERPQHGAAGYVQETGSHNVGATLVPLHCCRAIDAVRRLAISERHFISLLCSSV